MQQKNLKLQQLLRAFFHRAALLLFQKNYPSTIGYNLIQKL